MTPYTIFACNDGLFYYSHDFIIDKFVGFYKFCYFFIFIHVSLGKTAVLRSDFKEEIVY